MKKQQPSKPATKEQLRFLAHKTYQWYKTVFVQLQRFDDALDAAHGDYPWSDNLSASLVHTDRAFLIESIYRTYKYIASMNKELQNYDDNSFAKILELIEYQKIYSEIVSLRNINEHEEEYIIGGGREKEKFYGVKEVNGQLIRSQAFATIIIHDPPAFMVGTTNLLEITEKLKSCESEITHLCEEIFNTF